MKLLLWGLNGKNMVFVNKSFRLFAFFLCVNLFFLNDIFSQPKIKYRFKKTSEGLEYKILKKGKGRSVALTNRCIISYSFFHKTDTSELKTIVTNAKKDFLVGQEEVLKGWDIGFLLLKEGDSVLFKIPPHLGYGDKRMGSIKPNSTLYLFAKLLRIEEAFFPHNGLDTISFPSGLKKILVKKGEGKKSSPIDEVTLEFTGYVFSKNGHRQIFESSQTNSKIAKIQLGVGKFVQGLEEGIATMTEGEKATFIVPPNLGYGDKQAGKILPNTNLIYDIELKKSEYPLLTLENPIKKFAKDSILVEVTSHNSSTELISNSDVVKFHYKAYYFNDNKIPVIFDNSFLRENPIIQRPGSGKGFPGIELALVELKKGDKAKVTIPDKALVNRKKLPFYKSGMDVYFDLYIEDVIPYPFMAVASKDTVKTQAGLVYLENNIGFGDTVKNGTKVKVAYTVFYVNSNGSKIILDGSRDSGKWLEATIGNGANVKGFEEGCIGILNGGSRRLIIPPALGYGENGLPERGIPPGVDLIFDIERCEIIGN